MPPNRSTANRAGGRAQKSNSPFLRQAGQQRGVVQQDKAEGDGQQIKETIIAGRHDNKLKGNQGYAGNDSGTARRKYQKRNNEFDNEHMATDPPKPARQLMDVPIRSGRQVGSCENLVRLSFAGRVAAQQLPNRTQA
jgi:hypothetical protein